MPITKTSLRQHLLLWLLLPQLVFCLAGAALFFFVTLHFANQAIDKNLLHIANSLSRLSNQHANNSSALSEHIANIIFDDETELKQLFAISTASGQYLAGNQALMATTTSIKSSATPYYYNAQVDGKQYRILLIKSKIGDRHDTVQVALDLAARDAFTRNILISTTIPLALLIVATIFLVWWGIGRGLRPLARLQALMENRKAQDLSPLSLKDAPQELQALSNALNHLLAGTEESVNRQRRFIADAAHQLRTPLAGLKSQTELAMRENSPEGLRERLNMVHTSATRSIHLVNQLLTLARSEPGSQNGIPKVHMDLAKIIRDLTAELVPRALAARIDLGCDCFVTTAPMQGNSALLRELFINLVENAIKYIPRDGSVTVRLTEDATNYIVDVEDNGLGIPEADKQRVFERFYRREQTGNGCGLGMAIVKEIVERHAGTVALLDAEPHGLIVHVVLPKTELTA